MIFLAALMIGTGVVFVVRPSYVTHSSSKDGNNNNQITARWIGYSLIIMSCLFLVMASLQTLDQASHYIGH
ncbi:hypothetical protein QP794_29830 [Paenibacillus sp. UMB7766-LJ446]|uniref:hypothetical protein n=1 Tax=Paenibacillus TaxID=44249 RepID=UPI000BA070BC|nr:MULTISPECIES: hypothetical protein [Paenibacillus]MDK8194284.1 hypothetical protein [Paenibacillus sp. UMB7766-LJ446]OZQ61815.1 hypothetical protein CA599_27410 [Paenibacillus taichungensis]HBU81565.1 hypothetical protein [Paenibacillus sp.]